MRLRLLAPFVPLFALAAMGVHCAGSDDPGAPAHDDTGGESSVVEAGEETGDAGDAATDAPPDTGAPVSCTKQPSYAKPIRVNHNPDSLRRVAQAGMVQLADGRIMVAMLEALDATRYGVFARTVDPASGTASDDERLDVDADALTGGSSFQITTIAGGAVAVRYDTHYKVYSKGKWSPDLAASLPFSGGDSLAGIAAPSGQVLVTRTKGDAAPFGQAIVYRPDEGGAKGSWSPAQPLDLDGSTGAMRVDRYVLADGRFMTLLWQGSGGPAIRIRSLSGAWQAAYAKGEIGSRSSTFDYRVLSDGSIVLVALEPQGVDTYRATTSTWTATDGWSTTRLLSKVTADGAGVIPTTGWPFLFGVAGDELEFVSWVAACAGAAIDCTFKPISRRYKSGAWGDPIDLAVGSDTTGTVGLAVTSLDGTTPVVYRRSSDLTSVQLRARIGAAYSDLQTITADSPFFGAAEVTPRFYGGAVGFWSLAARNEPGAPPTPQAAVAGKIGSKSTTWGTVIAGSYELHGFPSGTWAYADGAGGFTVAANNATDGSGNAPVVAHFGSMGGTPEASAVIASDESSASFVNVPTSPARAGRDRAAIFVVSATLADTGGNRLRAYAWNGVGSGVPYVLANDSKAPRYFGNGLLVFGCGGAILYAIDPVDGTHALELVLVKESSAGT